MPVFIRRRMAMDFVDKQYSGDELMKKKAQLITELDELSVLSTGEIATLHGTGAITQADITYSRRLPLLIDELLQQKGTHWLMRVSVGVVRELLKMRVEKS